MSFEVSNFMLCRLKGDLIALFIPTENNHITNVYVFTLLYIVQQIPGYPVSKRLEFSCN